MVWFKSWKKKKMDTRELVVGQEVEVVDGDVFGGKGPVIEIMPWGVKVKLISEYSPLTQIEGKEVCSFDHDGRECHEDGTKGGLWNLRLPDE